MDMDQSDMDGDMDGKYTQFINVINQVVCLDHMDMDDN